MQRLPLFDEISIELSDRDAISCSNPSIPTNRDNLAFKALDLFRKETNYSFCCKIDVQKNIPIQAGLGGGSSNAATVLFALNNLHGNPLSKNELSHLGAKIGSDVPFFFTNGLAYATGRGEILHELSAPFIDLEIITPSFGLSTKEVFSKVEIKGGVDPETLLNAFLKGRPIFINDLEEAAFKIAPKLQLLKQDLKKKNSFVTMTGSGSSFILHQMS